MDDHESRGIVLMVFGILLVAVAVGIAWLLAGS